MSRPHLTKKRARTCKSVQKIIKTRFFVDNHEILLYFSFIDIISSSERLAAGKESGLNEQVERRQLSKCDYVAQELKTQIIAENIAPEISFRRNRRFVKCSRSAALRCGKR